MTKILTLIIIIFFGALSTSEASSVKKIRSSHNLENSRLVIELDKKSNFHIITLNNPNRLVIDIEDSKWDIKNHNSFKFSPQSNIKGVRYATRNKKNLRIVIETKNNPKKHNITLIPNNKSYGYRIVIDLFLNSKKNQTFPIKEKKEDKFILNQNKEEPIKNTKENAFSVIDQKQKKDVVILKAEKKNTLAVENNDIFSVIDKNEVPPNNEKIIKVKTTIEKDVNDKTISNLLKLRNKKDNIRSNTIVNKVVVKQHVIVIDPGHGGIDSGTIGIAQGIYEKDITLAYAFELKKKLEEQGRYKVFLTRNSDIYLTLQNIRNKARQYKADIFISLHADSSSNPNTNGASIYTLSDTAYDKESRILSEKENKSDIINNIDLAKEKKDIANLLIDLVRRDTSNISVNLATLFTNELGQTISMLKRSHRFAGFKVLKGVDIPAILIELGFLSNKNEERLLNSYNYRRKIAKALTLAINKHFDKVDLSNK